MQINADAENMNNLDPLVEMPELNIALLAAGDINTGSSRIRIYGIKKILDRWDISNSLFYSRACNVLFVQKKVTDDVLECSRDAKSRNCLIIFDVDDFGDALDYYAPRDKFRQMLSLADIVTASSPGQCGLLHTRYRVANPVFSPSMIDYFPEKAHRPKMGSGYPLRLMWFGSQSNIHMFSKYVDSLLAIPDLKISIMTGRIDDSEIQSRHQIEYVPWDVTTFIPHLQEQDLTILMHDGSFIDHQKSNNRMITSICWGVPAIVSRTPEYEKTALESAIPEVVFNEQDELIRIIEMFRPIEKRASYLDRAQPVIWGKYSPEAVTKDFLQIIRHYKMQNRMHPVINMREEPDTDNKNSNDLPPNHVFSRGREQIGNTAFRKKPNPNEQQHESTNSKRILIACTHFWPSRGGIETTAENLGNELVLSGYRVDIATLERSDRVSMFYRGMHIVEMDPQGTCGNFPLWAWQLGQLISSGWYFACILRSSVLNHMIWALENINIPSNTRVLVQPIINLEQFSRWAYEIDKRVRLANILKEKSLAVSLTQTGLDVQYMKAMGISYHYLPNAASCITSFCDFRKKYQLAEGTFLILHVANLYSVKNHIQLLRALHPIPKSWKLVMIGHPTVDEPDYANEFQAELGRFPGVVHIPGLPAEDVAAAMEAANVVVLASKGEGSPVSILEAMSHKRPWIATSSCGAATEFAGGIICPLEKFHDVLAVLANKSIIAKKLGELGYAHWKTCYSWPQVSEGWIDLIETGALSHSYQMPKDIATQMGNLLLDSELDTILRKTAQDDLENSPLQEHAQLLFQQGKELLAKGFPKQAIAQLQFAIGLDNRLIGCYYAIAACLIQLNRDNAALEALRHELRLNPRHKESLTLLRQLHGLTKPKQDPKHKVGSVMMRTPLVSIVVPTYNRPKELARALESIEKQTYQNYEVIVVNDAGVDVMAVIEQSAIKHRIKYIHHKSNLERSASRNTAIQAASGKYLAYLDDDDLYYPDHLETLVNALETSGEQVAYTDACRAHQKLADGRHRVYKRELCPSADFNPNLFLVQNFIPVLCIMHRKSCLDSSGFFDETLTTHEDWDLWIRMSRHFSFQHIRKTTCEFAWRDDGSSMSSGNRTDFLRTAEIIYKKYSFYSQANPSIVGAQQEFLRTLREEIARKSASNPSVVPNAKVADPTANAKKWMGGLSLHSIAGIPLDDAVRENPNLASVIVRVNRYLGEKKARLAHGIVAKELEELPECSEILYRMSQQQNKKTTPDKQDSLRSSIQPADSLSVKAELNVEIIVPLYNQMEKSQIVDRRTEIIDH